MTKKLTKIEFIDDGDDTTDEAVLAGLAKAKLARKLQGLRKDHRVQERISPAALLKMSDFKKS